MLTPSSNTILEPVTAAMLSDVPNVTAHFSRFKVTEIAIADASDRQFDEDEILRAAELLTHAKVNVIAWNGTSASWLGFERDEQLCERSDGGDRSCRVHLGPRLPRNFRAHRRFARRARHALCRQRADENNRQNWRKAGVLCSAERHSGLATISHSPRSLSATSPRWRAQSGSGRRRRGDRLHEYARRRPLSNSRRS